MKYLLILLALILSACVTTRQVSFKVNSEPAGASIEHKGVVVCGQTPCEIQLECEERWDGNASKMKSHSRARLMAYPQRMPASEKLFTSEKLVDPCLVPNGQTGNLRFDLRLDRVTPTQRFEIK